MSHYEVTQDEDRLILTIPMERRLLTLGCPLCLFGSLSLMTLGVLAILDEAKTPGVRHSSAPHLFFDPAHNYLGFLWLLSCLALAAAVAAYALVLQRANVVFSFDRSVGKLLRHGKPVTALRRIEYLRICRSAEEAGAAALLLIVYHDGHEMLIEESEEETIWRLGQAISDFLGVRIVERSATSVERSGFGVQGSEGQT